MKLRINNVKGFSGTVEIEDIESIPVDPFWRRRLKEAKTDNCVEVVKPRAKKEKPE